MENLSRDLEKNLTTFTPPKHSKRGKQGTFLLVGSDGEVRQVRWVKGLLVILVVMLIAALIAAGCFYFLYINMTQEKNRLQASLDELQQQKAALQVRKEAPVIQTPVVAESKSEPGPVPVRKKPAEKPVQAAPPPEIASVQEKPEADEVLPRSDETGADANDKEKNILVADAQPEEKKPVEPEKPLRVSAEKFNISYNKRRRILRAEFEIRNVDRISGRLSGHAIMILKPNRGGQRRWLTMPPVKLVSGKPTGEEPGETFSISHFKTLKFQAKNQRSLKRFKTATVFVFTDTGELLLEKDFPVATE